MVDPITDYKTNSGYLIFGTCLNLHMHYNFIKAAVDNYELLPGLERLNGPTSAYLILITVKVLVTTPRIHGQKLYELVITITKVIFIDYIKTTVLLSILESSYTGQYKRTLVYLGTTVIYYYCNQDTLFQN